MPTTIDQLSGAGRCPQCRAPLDAGGICMACVLAMALEGEGGEVEPDGVRRDFGALKTLASEMRVGAYVLKRLIASGGMGTVWEAENTRLRRTVALKALRSLALATDEEKMRFRTEAEASAQLDHRHIVPIYEIGEDGDQIFFTMKLIEGGSLADRLKRGRLGIRTSVVLMKKVAEAVHHAHQRGVLHRDLKPGNILLDENGEPWLTDFGLAKLLNMDSQFTLSSAQIGTPQYMSPEQAGGRAREITTASDVWALGAILYQLLAGQAPFTGHSPADIFRRICDDEPTPLRRLATEADRDLETLCSRCLEKNPADRLAGAGVLAGELERWLTGQPIQSRPTPLSGRVLKWCQRHPTQLVAGLAVAGAIAVGGVASTVLWRRAEAARAVAVNNEGRALRLAETEKRSAFAAALANALAAREHHDLRQARALLESTPPELRGFEWRLLSRLCAGDELSGMTFPNGGIPDCLAPLPEGDATAIITSDGRLVVRRADGSDLEPPRTLPPPGKLDANQSISHHGLRFSPNGELFAYSYGDLLRVLDRRTLAIRFEKPLKMPQAEWLDDGRLVFGWNGAIGRSPKMGAWVWHAATGATDPMPDNTGAPLALSRDRTTLAVSIFDGGQRVVVVKADDLGLTAPLLDRRPFRDQSASLLALSGDGGYVAIARGEAFAQARAVDVLAVASGDVLASQGYREPMTGLAFDPGQPTLAISGCDALIRLIHFTRPIPEGSQSYDDAVDPAICEPLDRNGPHSGPRQLLTRSAQQGRAVFLFGHEAQAVDLAFRGGDGCFSTVALDGTLRRWSTEVPKPAPRLSEVDCRHYGFMPAASADGRRVLFRNRRWETELWEEGRERAVVKTGHFPLAVLSDGGFFTLSPKLGEIVRWKRDPQTGQPVEEWRCDGPPLIEGFRYVRRGVLTRGEDRIVGAAPGKLFVVDLATRRTVTTGDLRQQLGLMGVADHAVSPDGRWIAATAFGRRTQIRPVSDPGTLHVLLGDERNYDTAVAFHPDGSRLYTGNEDGTIRVWDTSTWQEIGGLRWSAHRGAVTALAVSNDGTLVASGGDDTLKLWRAVKPGEGISTQLLSFPQYHAPSWVQFAGDGSGHDRALLHVAPWRTLEVWPAESR